MHNFGIKASEEERIKQQLQAVAEDVAALALQPSVPTASVALGTQNLGSIEGSKELEKAILDEEIEVIINYLLLFLLIKMVYYMNYLKISGIHIHTAG